MRPLSTEVMAQRPNEVGVCVTILGTRSGKKKKKPRENSVEAKGRLGATGIVPSAVQMNAIHTSW